MVMSFICDKAFDESFDNLWQKVLQSGIEELWFALEWLDLDTVLAYWKVARLLALPI